MPNLKETQSAHIVADRRERAASLLRIFFPANVHDSHQGLEEAGRAVERGEGALITPNHFSYWDGPSVFLNVAASNKHLRNKEWLAPVAMHIFRGASTLNEALHTEVELYSIVTSSTLNNEKYKGMKRNTGLRDYIDGAIEVLGKGGVVVLFPQATRREKLTMPTGQDIALEMLVRRAERSGVSNFGILPVGFGIPGVKDYSKVNRFNMFRHVEVNIGRFWPKDTARAVTQASGLTMDQWIVRELGDLVQPEYNNLP